MNILLTNDDGIGCEGLQRLAEGLRRGTGHKIYVLAPDSDRSGVSNSISLNQSIRIKAQGPGTWVCTGTPADCVMAASLGCLPIKPELLISGINAGPNLGTDIVYSGTAAAARQGALHHIPSIALSLAGLTPPLYWDGAVSFAVAQLDALIELWEEDIFINVNIPNTPQGPDGMAITFPTRRHYQDKLVSFDAPDGYTYCFINSGFIENENDPGSDWEVVSRNLVSVSPVYLYPVVLGDRGAVVPPHKAVIASLEKSGTPMG
ncbi:5'/3'-nucleotidase SurE [Treponema sp. TIM-1]|uniref:5'/3'-nucleotidase SurE n=1 Tax=Treponema sp. TIM-1 TaxID=2898417 RepID=UPI0039807EE6